MATYPVTTKVIAGEVYGPNDNDYTGMYQAPNVSLVLAKATYGPTGVLFGHRIMTSIVVASPAVTLGNFIQFSAVNEFYGVVPGDLVYDWTWGDGTESLDAGTVPQHVYATTGIFEARVTVMNDDLLGYAEARVRILAPTTYVYMNLTGRTLWLRGNTGKLNKWIPNKASTSVWWSRYVGASGLTRLKV